MFRKNERHQQVGLFETVEQLPEMHRLLLERSWAGAFYRELFRRIDEGLFAVLYSDKASRPNTPVNVVVGMEVMKSGFGWSDEELYREFVFNLQVRYALGLRDLASGNFAARQAAERVAINTPVQGSAADLVKRAMLAVDRRLAAEHPGQLLLLQVHDELLLEVDEDRADAVAAMVRDEMVGAIELAVPLVVEVGRGRTWDEAH